LLTAKAAGLFPVLVIYLSITVCTLVSLGRA